MKNKDISLKGKVVAVVVMLLTIVPGFCLFFFYSAVKDEVEKENLDRMAFYAKSFEQSLSENGMESFAKHASALKDRQGRVTLVAEDGVVRYDSAGTNGMDNHFDRPEIRKARKDGVGSALRYSFTLRTHMHYYAMKTRDLAGRPVFIRVSYPVSALTRILRAFLWRAALAAASIAAISLLFWFWLTERLFRPLEEIVRLSERIGTDVPEARFPIFHDVELQKLSAALNVMSERLKDADADIRSRREELARIVEALPIGVILMDGGRKVRYLNGVTRALFGNRGDVVKGSPVERLISSGEIYDMLDGPDGCGIVSLTPPAGYAEGVLGVEVCLLTLTTGRLMTLRDVTESRRLEETRRNFTIDAGHELQTPLTAIRAAAELLLDDLNGSGAEEKNPEGKKPLVLTILRQQERMTALIDDLLLLAKLENPGKAGEKNEERAPEDLVEILNTVAGEFRENPAARSIAFEVEGPGGASGAGGKAFFTANRPELLRAISNIVSNAARKCAEKYGSGPGGKVRLELRKEEGQGERFWAITISDNGPGVDPEVARRIFKSFQGNERNRGKWGSGGHGLGLSIAARVVQVHGGSIELLPDSPLGGAAFEIRLPDEV